MVNRELIRLKAVQIIYSYYASGMNEQGKKGIETSQKELLFSLDKAYDLYHAMLQLLLEVRRVAVEDVEQRSLRNKQLSKNLIIDTRFVNNRLLHLLAENEQLRDFTDKNNQLWAEDEEMIKNIYRAFCKSSDYEMYLKEEDSFQNDADCIRRLYRSFIVDNDDIAAALEDKSIFWNDDKHIVDTFVLKTIKQMREDNAPDTPLLPQYERTEDMEFAVQLHKYTIENGEYYRTLIEEKSINWDMHRIALMDTVIMQTALAEITSFPTIPVAVSINEYINISKMYSTNRNWSYVNATLDNITKQLEAEGKIEKV
ncbi:MAG: transcription antitermination protein NusB [Bacteroidales bacterium]|nr:transcription antitermination protein NusB [Bacteroidales bacterium]